MKKIIFTSFIALFLSACATGPRVEVLVDNFKGTEKKIIMLSNNYHLKKLRIELRKLGFQMPKFALYKEETVTETKNTEGGSVSRSVKGHDAVARYGIDVTDVSYLDTCIAGEGKKYNITLEITDIETNEVVAYITNGGWTANCFPYSGDLYAKLAKQISDLWKNKYKAIEVEEDEEDLEEK